MIWCKIIGHKITLKTINGKPMALSKCMYCLNRYAEKGLV
jgi:hypothetical protein